VAKATQAGKSLSTVHNIVIVAFMRGFRSAILAGLVCATSVGLFVSCVFGPSKAIGVMSYRNGKVFLQNKDFYRVGTLPNGWQRMKSRARTISFYNEGYKSSITTDAFCGKSFSDRPLDTLAGELTSVLSDRTTVSTKDMTLSDRGAKRFLVVGKMDGVPLQMDIVVVKKNACNFDFVAVMSPDAPIEVKSDFENFFNGFRY
jgi:hypothetical protein